MSRTASAAAALGAVVLLLACGGGAAPPPPPAPSAPDADYADEAAAWCQGSPFLAERCGTLHGGAPPPAGVWVGLSFDARKPPGPNAEAGSLSILHVGPGGAYAVGGVIGRYGEWDLIDRADAAVRACFTAPCPDGPELPPAIHDLAQKTHGQVGHALASGSDHVHARTAAGHGYPQVYDLVRSDAGAGFWVAAVGTPPYPLREVALFLPVPARRGPPPPPAPDLADAAVAWCRGVRALASRCGGLGGTVPATGTFVGLAFRPGDPDPLADPWISVLHLRGRQATLLGQVPPDGRAGYAEAVSELRACLSSGCPAGPVLPDGIEDWPSPSDLLVLRSSEPVGDHVHGSHAVDERHVERVDLATTGGGALLAARGVDGLDGVSIHVGLPAGR